MTAYVSGSDVQSPNTRYQWISQFLCQEAVRSKATRNGDMQLYVLTAKGNVAPETNSSSARTSTSLVTILVFSTLKDPHCEQQG